MPCLTHVLTRQPEAADGSGSAARTSPLERAARSRANTSRASARSALAPATTRAAMSSVKVAFTGLTPLGCRCCLGEETQRLEHRPDLRTRGIPRRHHRQAVGLLQ